eukprot:403371170
MINNNNNQVYPAQRVNNLSQSLANSIQLRTPNSNNFNNSISPRTPLNNNFQSDHQSLMSVDKSNQQYSNNNQNQQSSGYGIIVGNEKYNLNVQSEYEDDEAPMQQSQRTTNGFSQSLSNGILQNKRNNAQNRSVSRNEDQFVYGQSMKAGIEKQLNLMQSIDKNIEYANPFASSQSSTQKRLSPPTKQSNQQLNNSMQVQRQMPHNRNESMPRSLAQKLIQNQVGKSNQRDSSGIRDSTMMQNQLGKINPNQISQMSVEEIIAMAQQHKRTQSRDNLQHHNNSVDTVQYNNMNSTIIDHSEQSPQQIQTQRAQQNFNLQNQRLDQQQQPHPQQQQQLRQSMLMNPKNFANHLIKNSMNTHQGAGSYEKMIESKVFQFLNGFFANQNSGQQPRSQQNNGMLQNTQQLSQLFNGTQHTQNSNDSQNPQQQQLFNQSPIPHNNSTPPQQQSVSPIMNRSQYHSQFQNQDDLHEIKSTTFQLTKEMKMMRKVVEELSMSINEKDAEIIKLNMHLGDEKKRFQNLIRKQSQKSLMKDASSSSLIKRSADTSQIQNSHLVDHPDLKTQSSNNFQNTPQHQQYSGQRDVESQNNQIYEALQQIKEENQQLVHEVSQLKKYQKDLQLKHKEEVKKIEDSKHSEKQRLESHIQKLEKFNKELQLEIKKHQDEIEKALKIHRANEQLMQKNDELKQYLKKLNTDIDALHSDRERDQAKYQQLLKHAQMLSKNNNTNLREDGPCKSCLQTLHEKEDSVVQTEDLKRLINQQRLEIKELKEKSLTVSKNGENSSQDKDQLRQNQIMIQKIEQQFHQQLEQKQQELDLKDEIATDLQKTIDELKSQAQQYDEEIKALQDKLQKNNSSQNDLKMIEQLKLMVEKDALQILESQQREGFLNQEIRRMQQENQQLQEDLEVAKNPKKKKK